MGGVWVAPGGQTLPQRETWQSGRSGVSPRPDQGRHGAPRQAGPRGYSLTRRAGPGPGGTAARPTAANGSRPPPAPGEAPAARSPASSRPTLAPRPDRPPQLLLGRPQLGLHRSRHFELPNAFPATGETGPPRLRTAPPLPPRRRKEPPGLRRPEVNLTLGEGR